MKLFQANIGSFSYERTGAVSILRIGRLERMRVGDSVRWTVEPKGENVKFIQKIRDWFAERQRNRENAAHKRGYEWAVHLIEVHGLPGADVMVAEGCNGEFNSAPHHDAFDKGALEALENYRKIHRRMGL